MAKPPKKKLIINIPLSINEMLRLAVLREEELTVTAAVIKAIRHTYGHLTQEVKRSELLGRGLKKIAPEDEARKLAREETDRIKAEAALLRAQTRGAPKISRREQELESGKKLEFEKTARQNQAIKKWLELSWDKPKASDEVIFLADDVDRAGLVHEVEQRCERVDFQYTSVYLRPDWKYYHHGSNFIAPNNTVFYYPVRTADYNGLREAMLECVRLCRWRNDMNEGALEYDAFGVPCMEDDTPIPEFIWNRFFRATHGEWHDPS